MRYVEPVEVGDDSGVGTAGKGGVTGGCDEIGDVKLCGVHAATTNNNMKNSSAARRLMFRELA